MKPFLIVRQVAFVGCTLLGLVVGGTYAIAQAPRPYHQNIVPSQKRDPLDYVSVLPKAEILLGTPVPGPIFGGQQSPVVSPPSGGESGFSWRTGAAVLYAAGLYLMPSEYTAKTTYTTNGPLPPQAVLGGQDFGTIMLAKMAYQDYFFIGPGHNPGASSSSASFRRQVEEFVSAEQPGPVGSPITQDVLDDVSGLVPSACIPDAKSGDYDVVLTAYLTLYYKYYDVLSSTTRDHVFKDLLTQRGKYDLGERYVSNLCLAIVPETENHRLMIQAAKYLTNQLYFQKSVDDGNPDHANFDNNRNGMVDVILEMLYGFLTNDFIEYNARPYQDYTVTALMNLASYAYDDRVQLAARMVLDYISAKVAVSSQDLRRSTPFRRRNEPEFYGPAERNNSPLQSFLSSPLLYKLVYKNANKDDVIYEPDPQGAFYAMLAGNTEILGDNAPGNYAFEMVHAGLSDYRVPPSIVDLFVNASSRNFYQSLNHVGSSFGSQASSIAVHEIYAGSPSYLISAGGNATKWAYAAVIPFSDLKGTNVDLGVAVPTTLIPHFLAPAGPEGKKTCPNAFGTCLADIIQFGTVSTDPDTANLCVSPNFACGGPIYLPRSFDPEQNVGDPSLVQDGNWTFVNKGSDIGKPGYYLAIFRFHSVLGLPVQCGDPCVARGLSNALGLLEAHDTSFGAPLTFETFKELVKSANPAGQFTVNGTNRYTTQSGQTISFTFGPKSIVAGPGLSQLVPPFAQGTVINSGSSLDHQGLPVGSGRITITNPTLGTQTVLDMHNQSAPEDPLYGLHHPSRTSESGEVERTGGDWVIWVNFNSPPLVPSGPGDFYSPFRTLAEATNRVAQGGTIKIIPGSRIEKITIKKPMTLKSFPGTATISASVF
ncbi:MAG: hypothetical protein QOJ99_4696 [Bryobacterales bacterium]|jgi:hypothetical protein|nr:hypothetical protein [Bryobacterales bacterium]